MHTPPGSPPPVDEATELLFQALRNHKQQQLERETQIMNDTLSIADSLLSKRRMADETKTVVSAAASYANNEHYVAINSGRNSQIRLSKDIHPLNPDECDVYTSLVEACKDSFISAMPNHHINSIGEIEGFRFTCGMQELSHCIPFGRRMFHRTTMVECEAKKLDAYGKAHESERVLRLLLQQNELKNKLVKIVQAIHHESIGNEASFDCMPDHSDVIGEEMHMNKVINNYHIRKSADCRAWSPELPSFVGIYHAYVRGFNKDERMHKLFLVTSGGCNAICDQYYNLTVDVRYDMTIKDVFNSDETWYLRKVNQRNNAHILYRVAAELEIEIPIMTDPCCADGSESDMAVPTTETLLYDIMKQSHNRVSYLSNCVDTLSCKNGILCNMHPSEVRRLHCFDLT